MKLLALPIFSVLALGAYAPGQTLSGDFTSSPSASGVQPSVDVLIYNDTSNTTALCSSASTKTFTVQNGTCVSSNPGFNSFKITAERNFPAKGSNSSCFFFALESSSGKCGGVIDNFLALNGSEINRCENSRRNGTVANTLLLYCSR